MPRVVAEIGMYVAIVVEAASTTIIVGEVSPVVGTAAMSAIKYYSRSRTVRALSFPISAQPRR